MASLTDADLELVAKLQEFRFDPLNFVRYAYHWGDGDLASQEGPDEWQSDLLRTIGEKMEASSSNAGEAVRIAVSSGHGSGKSAVSAWINQWFIATRPNCAGVVTANTKTQLETKTWREMSVWHKRLICGHWFDWTATKFAAQESPETWGVSAIPWSKERPEAFAGLHAKDVIMTYDEASAIDDSIWDVSEGGLTTDSVLWLAFGNPTRNTGRFHACFNKYRALWNGFKVDTRKAKMANSAQIAQWLKTYGEDSDFFKIRVRGEFPRSGSNQFITQELVDAAVERDAEPDGGALVVGIDVAREGLDHSCIVVRRGNKVEHIERHHGLDGPQLANVVAAIVNRIKPDAIFIDKIGVGASPYDHLRLMGFDVIGVVSSNNATDEQTYFNLRTELAGKTRDWLETGSIPDDRQLIDDLTRLEYGFDGKGRFQLVSKKDTAGPSPDTYDALAMTFARPVANALASAMIAHHRQVKRPSRQNIGTTRR